MSSDDFEKRFQHHVEFMLEQHARFDDRLSKLETAQLQQAENINRLVGAVAASQAQIDSMITEMRDGFNKLILANEVTRDLAEKATLPGLNNNQRLGKLEEKAS